MKTLKVMIPDALIEKIEIRTEQRILKELNLILYSFTNSKLMPYTQILDSQCKGFIAFCNTLGCSFKNDSIVCPDRKDWSKEDSVYKGIFSEEMAFVLEGLASEKEVRKTGFYHNKVISNPTHEGKWPGVPFDQPKPRLGSTKLVEGLTKSNVNVSVNSGTYAPPPPVPPSPRTEVGRFEMSEAVPPRPFRD